ncbi:hypothetical protein B0H13DRAFT_2503310 [Mycena leptocephala]|nr:hypothetical protein B0H13DRAFT_2503310 [Mycena leptocephala]
MPENSAWPGEGLFIGTSDQERSAPVKVKGTRIGTARFELATSQTQQRSANEQLAACTLPASAFRPPVDACQWMAANTHPIRDLAQTVPLHWAGEVVVRVVDPEVRYGRVERGGGGGGGEGVLRKGVSERERIDGCTKDASPSLFPKPRHRPRLPNSPQPRQYREQAMTEHKPQEREQDNARAGASVGWERRKGVKGSAVARGLERRREIQVQEREEKVRRESEERGEEEHLQGRGGVDSPAEPYAHVLHLGHRGLGPADEGRFRAGWREQGDGGWKDAYG